MWKNYEGYGMGWHGLEWIGMALFMLIPILLVLAILKYLIGGRRARPPEGGKNPDALALLDERYARGEMDRDEYLQKLDDLKRS